MMMSLGLLVASYSLGWYDSQNPRRAREVKDIKKRFSLHLLEIVTA